MTLQERVARLTARFPFTARQAHFVALVALIGGYCLRRQYVTFAGIELGENARKFLDGLVAQHWADRARPCRNRGFLYHVKARPIYDALDLANNRNRRTVSAPQQARRVMLLDFAIAHPTATWFAAEDDKVGLFVAEQHVALRALPSRVYHGAIGTATTRRFVAKWPIFQIPGDARICFVTLGLETSGRTIARFLSDHAALFRELDAWEVVVAYPPVFEAGVDAWRAAFAAHHFTAPVRLCAADAQALSAYFRVRHALEGGVAGTITIDRVHEERRRRFAGSAYDALYRFWCAHGGPQRPDYAPPDFGQWRPAGTFSTYRLPHSYDLFGRYPGVV